jgi:hypothetical protein
LTACQLTTLRPGMGYIMARLLVGNNRTEELVGDLTSLGSIERRFAGCGAQRIMWFARDGDVVVLPWAPEEEYLEYVSMFTGVRLSSLHLAVPAPGRLGTHILSRDRLEGQEFQETVRREFAGRPVDDVFALCGDGAVASLARALNADSAMPGYHFAASGGTRPVNSKSLFRAIAGGAGVPITPGWVVYDQADACHIITRELAQGNCVILKQDLQSGGTGNEVLCPEAGVRVIGALGPAVVLNSVSAVRTYLERRWGWLAGGHWHAVVIERYFPGATPIFAEFDIRDQGPVFIGHGEMLMAPAYAGVIVPAPKMSSEVESVLVETGRQVCMSYCAIGYRGTVSVDAIVTADDHFFLNEINCRIGGSTHLQKVIGNNIVGPDYQKERLLLERGGWRVSSFKEAVGRLDANGLGYNREARAGVILICDFGLADGSVRYCIVAEDIDAVRKYERRLWAVYEESGYPQLE